MTMRGKLGGTGAVPRVSVLLPTRNGETSVAAAIRSVLEQSYEDFELIVVDDGSTDGTGRVLAELASRDRRVCVITPATGVGLQRALNTALDAAVGSLVARIDDDDVWIEREKLAWQVDAMERVTSLQLLGTGCEMYDPDSGARFVRKQPTGDAEIRRIALSWNPFVHSSVMFRRETALACGGYSERFRHVEDYDLWLHMGLRGTFANLPQVCVRYRTRVGSWSRRQRTSWEQLQLVLRYRRCYPGAGEALMRAAVRLAVDGLPIRRTTRAWLRSLRRR